jgi:hypothetical protein
LLGRISDGGSVIAARGRGDAGRGNWLRQKRVEGATRFERSRVLQVFELQADRPVIAERALGKPPRRRAPDMRRNARVRGADVVASDAKRGRLLKHAASLDVLPG